MIRSNALIYDAKPVYYRRWVQAVFQAAETESVRGATTENAPVQLQRGRDESKDDVQAIDIDISEGIAAEMFGIPSSTEEVHHVGFFCMHRAIMF